jgi:hypothetical protein
MKYTDEEVAAGWRRIEGMQLTEVEAPKVIPISLGSMRVHKDKIEGRPCYAVQEYRKGKAFDCWLDVTSEPFGTLEEAQNYLESIK